MSFNASEMKAFFEPKSIAVLGASSDPKKFGGRILLSLKKSGFAGEIFAINRAEKDVQGFKA